MNFGFSRLIPKKRNGILALRIGKEEIDFLLFETEKGQVNVLSYGSEPIAFFNVRQTLEKLFVQLSSYARIGELIATFEAPAFRAQFLSETFAPGSLPHRMDHNEVLSIEREMRLRAGHAFQRALFQESGILPKEFALRRLRIVERRINGYQVPKLAGFKSGEIEFSILGLFLLESAFTPVERFARAHNISRIKVVHVAEALEAFCERRRQRGIYFYVEEEKTQIALYQEDRFLFLGLLSMGAHDFTESLSHTLGMGRGNAQVFQEQYFNKNLSLGVQEKLQMVLLPQLKKFGILVKQKLSQAKIPLPEFVWVFGKGEAMRNLRLLFDEDVLDDLPFAQKPSTSFLLPRDVWSAKNFSGAWSPRNTIFGLMADYTIR